MGCCVIYYIHECFNKLDSFVPKIMKQARYFATSNYQCHQMITYNSRNKGFA